MRCALCSTYAEAGESLAKTKGEHADIAEGAKENALPFASIDDYTRMAAAMRTLEAEIAQGRRPTVTIVGAGYAGVELASCVQNRLGSSAQVQIVSSGDDIMPVRVVYPLLYAGAG